MARYITTGELGILARGRQLTIEDYVEEFKNAYEI